MKSTSKAISTLPIDFLSVHKGLNTFRAIQNKLRQQLIVLIHKKGSICVKDIYRTFKITQSEASKQLGILRRAGFVKIEKQGLNVFYSVDYTRLQKVNSIIKEVF